MTTAEHTSTSPWRVVLIDLDWQDADLLPELLRAREVCVGLAIGASPDDAGVRVAALCGLPRSLELADLTREIFDLALIGDHSPRREQLDRLLRSLGTRSESPRGFVERGCTLAAEDPDEPAGPTLPERTGDSVISEPAAAEPGPGSDAVASSTDEPLSTAVEAQDLGPESGVIPPGPDDSQGLERILGRWIDASRASGATLHLMSGETLTPLARSGAEDPLLEAIVAIAFRLDAPQLVTRLDGPFQGRLWAAWPFRTPLQRGVLSVGGADGRDGPRIWEQAVRSLVTAWSLDEPGCRDASPRLTVLTPEEFSIRIQSAIDRQRREGFRFVLHRLSFEAPEATVTALLNELCDRVRDTDSVCRPAPQDLLLLCAGTPSEYSRVRRRIELLWRHAWVTNGRAGEPAAIVDETVDLAGTDPNQEPLDAP